MDVAHMHPATLFAKRLDLDTHSRQPYAFDHADILRDVLLQIGFKNGPQGALSVVIEAEN
jgi:hypothetical protein